jgi:hypothetical protein
LAASEGGALASNFVEVAQMESACLKSGRSLART